jgi:hypothetical protein
LGNYKKIIRHQLAWGTFLDGKLAQAKWGNNSKKKNSINYITYLEYFPILATLYIFCDKMRNKKVMFHCDNAAEVEIINNQTSK